MTQWLNTSSTELKYNLIFASSNYYRLTPVFIAGLIGLINILIHTFILPNPNLLSILLFNLGLIITLILIQKLWPLKSFNQAVILDSNSRTISTYTNQHYNIAANSLLLPWGILLRLNQIKCYDGKPPKQLTRWVFIDSLSDQDYRRLARVVNGKSGARGEV